MFSLHLPVNPTDVSKPVESEHLVPWVPRTSWDGWFAIAIFPPQSEVRWVKAHYYHGACRKGHTPFAAVEGFGEKSEMLVSWARADRVTVLQRELEDGTPEASPHPLRVEREGRFRLEGEAPQYTMRFTLPGERARARFDFETAWPIWWSRWGRLLTYAGQHGSVRTGLYDGETGDEAEREGFGVMEHVCGISLPFDFTKLLPFHYHWDVLAFHTPGAPADSAAGLSIGRRGETRLELRAAARLPGRRSPEAMQGLSIRYLEMSVLRDARCGEVTVPVRWEGVLRSARGVFRYEAVAATPPATIIPGGGMLGFDFQGEWRSAGAGTEAWAGTGFCEVGDFSRRLARIFHELPAAV